MAKVSGFSRINSSVGSDVDSVLNMSVELGAEGSIITSVSRIQYMQYVWEITFHWISRSA